MLDDLDSTLAEFEELFCIRPKAAPLPLALELSSDQSKSLTCCSNDALC